MEIQLILQPFFSVYPSVITTTTTTTTTPKIPTQPPIYVPPPKGKLSP